VNFREFVEKEIQEESWWKWTTSLQDTDVGDLDPTQEFPTVKQGAMSKEDLWHLPCEIHQDENKGDYIALYFNPRAKLFDRSRDWKKLYRKCAKIFYSVTMDDIPTAA
jgi:hypothetical protein